MQFDADILEKLSEDTDDLGDDAAEELAETFDPSKVIDLEEAASAARNERDGIITEWKIEGEDSGRVRYEFEIRPAGTSPDTDDEEVQIDAEDGSVIRDD